MSVDSAELRKSADRRRSEGRYAGAGDGFTSAAYASLAESQQQMSVEGTDIGIGLYCLLAAAVCYRITGEKARSRNRCNQGTLIAADLRKHVAEHEAQIGLLYEFEGDFAVVGETGGADEQYDQAAEYYRNYNTPGGWQGEPAFDWNYAFFARVADAAGHDIEDEEYVQSYLLQRIDYKRKWFADIVDDVYESEEWLYEKPI